MPGLTSASGVLGFLSDEQPELKIFALQTLNDDIDAVWTEVAGYIGQIEALYEDREFPERQLAALVLSKVFYHLQEYDDSMTFALGAGDLFVLDNEGEFEETIISKCVDTYISISAVQHAIKNPTSLTFSRDKSHAALATSFATMANEANIAASLTSPTTPFSHSTIPSKSLLSRGSVQKNVQSVVSDGKDKPSQTLNIETKSALLGIIERIFERCLSEGRYKQVVGIAIEAYNLKVIRQVIRRASEDDKKLKENFVEGSQYSTEGLMEYILEICMDVVQERAFRTEILRLILDMLNEIPAPDHFSIAKCAVFLNQDEEASRLLRDLVTQGHQNVASTATAYQIAFDLYDNGTQEFLAKVIRDIPAEVKEPGVEETEPNETDPLTNDMPSQATKIKPLENYTETQYYTFDRIRKILDGSETIKLNLEFLYRNNRTDISILNKVRDSLEGRNSIFHTAVTFCNAFMNQGTTNDKFFRDNLEWLGKAVNWSKFSATAALGVIHRGNISQCKKLLEPYLPRSTALGGSIFSQGGALYAYGLIHANHGSDALEYLQDQFSKAQEEIIQHGGALGLGIAGMATGSEDIYINLRHVLYTDSALNGEAVGLAMGLIMLGTGNMKALEDMITYAHDTQHEKIVRGLAVGMALIMYGRQEGADELIEGLLNEPDPTLRYGGIMTVAMAYCGTGNNKAVRKLLHIAVSDVNDDVRRIAVMSLGFILFRKPGGVPRMVELLSESYNPHVRYGAAMALGISCAGTGLDEAIDLLEPMIKDPTDFVRQGALISLAMIMVQQNEVMNPKVASIRKTLKKIVGDRHEDAMTKFGCALALGIIDAGGRNCTIGLQTQTGNLNMAGIVGMAVFTQYWYWFPFTHFLSLSFIPTSMVCLDHELDIPDFKFYSATRPSLFDYTPEQEIKTDEAPTMIATAVLSTTAQAKRRAQKKERAQRRESMDIDQVPLTPKSTVPAAMDDRMDVDEVTKDKKSKIYKKDDGEKEVSPAEIAKKKFEREKIGYEIDNMSRVLPAQVKFISFPTGRYRPVKKPTGGVILMIDTQPDTEKILLEEKLKKPNIDKTTGSYMPEDIRDEPLSLRRNVDRQMSGVARNTEYAIQPYSDGRQGIQGSDESYAAGSGPATESGTHYFVDEDDESAEEAVCPKEFEYFTDDEDL
ncbi:Bgt-5256 [Blumeria graminis f. sp. tritici]|uniref:26S proteasome regulatory subunit RPN2 n=2 Tax=Blumeria graminis f. sp. tritici TaxID=62690 RepID=A0A381LJG5_BLUGR|nr:Subunit of the 26S proteasome substrate of the N-acetyltransferase Nat1p [Blumeria graminis f. sp. tritici 96224]VCU40875.1 Bgt-5256 [Blumeria graminis f. sp. tritici]